MSVSSHSRGRRFTAYSTHINSSDNYGRRCLTTEWWHAGVVICLDLGADLRMAQLMPVPLTVSCFSKIQIGFAFLVPAHPGSPGKRAVKRVCVCIAVASGFIAGSVPVGSTARKARWERHATDYFLSRCRSALPPRAVHGARWRTCCRRTAAIRPRRCAPELLLPMRTGSGSCSWPACACAEDRRRR